jgi:glycosyltransferase involved in cell wall biosynthesis
MANIGGVLSADLPLPGIRQAGAAPSAATPQQVVLANDLTGPRQPRIAIVHDWLVGGGAERVIYELHTMYPDAPIYTSYCTDEWRQKLDGKVVTGFLQKWPFGKLRKFVGPLRIWWFTHLDFTGYDLVISSSGNGEAKGVKVPEGTKHVCYCHSPTHYYWRHYDRYMARPGFGAFDPLARLGLRLLVGPLRKWDLKASQRPDYFIANSTHIQGDIARYYNRDSTVIHAPIDVTRFDVPAPAKRIGFVTAGRQVPLKRTDIVVEACTRLNVPLTVIGRGPDHNRLVAMAGPNVTFLTDVSDDEMPHHFAAAQAFLFASFEDFGIVPIEAMAAGTPVIAYKAGGTLDYIEPGVTGTFFADQAVDALVAAIHDFDASTYDEQVIRQKAHAFAPAVFRAKMTDFISTIEA